MSDLTDEEIIATRKLNGVDDDLYRKIDVGEYIKTNKGNIGKIIEIRLGFNKDTQLYQDIYKLDNGLWTVLDYIVKHSKQLIDLIEKDDYVNGYKVISVDYDVMNDTTECIELDLNSNYQYNFISIRQIQTIPRTFCLAYHRQN